MEVVGDTFRSARQYRHRNGIALHAHLMTAACGARSRSLLGWR